MVLHWTSKGYVEVDGDDTEPLCYVIGNLDKTPPDIDQDGENVFCDWGEASSVCSLLSAENDGEPFGCWILGGDKYDTTLDGIAYCGDYFKLHSGWAQLAH